jgi:hypothetical protein
MKSLVGWYLVGWVRRPHQGVYARLRGLCAVTHRLRFNGEVTPWVFAKLLYPLCGQSSRHKKIPARFPARAHFVSFNFLNTVI